MAALDVLLDPVIHAQMVEPIASLSKARMGRGETGILHVLSQGRSERRKVSVLFFRAVIAVAEIHDPLRLLCSTLLQVNSLEAETLNKGMYGVMVAINKFTAPLADHAIGPRRGIGVHATTDAVRRLVEAARKTGILQGKGGVESCNTCTNNSNTGHDIIPPLSSEPDEQ